MSRHAGQTRDEAGQFDEVPEAQKRTPIADGDLRIRSGHVRPLWRNCANGQLVNLQQEPLAVTAEVLTHASELPSAERVERVGDADKVRRSGGNVCIPNGVTSAWSAVASSGRRPTPAASH